MKIICVAGYKKSGKTTLVEQLIAALRHLGSVGTIKHLHEHSLSREGTDTSKHTRAGARMVTAVTPDERVTFSQKNDLTSALDGLADEGMDFAVVEGFKESDLPKIALGEIEAPHIVKRLDRPEHANIEEIVDLILSMPEYHTLKSLIHKIKANPDIEKAGAIGTFTGIVRRVTGESLTEFLEFEEYTSIARQTIQEICAQLKEREGIVDVLIHHKTGIIPASDDIVYIVVASGHRHQLFPVLREAIERLKAEVPVWKKEHTLKGEWWVHDTMKR